MEEQISKETLSESSKIELYEKNGWFDRDIYDDPETIPLKPGEVDFLKKKLSSKIKTRFANAVAISYFEKKIKKKDGIYIKDIVGLEKFESVKGGAVVTCNHFHPFDNYAIFHAIRKSLKKNGKRDLWKVIREGNYKQWKGLYKLFFQNCNTLPLGSDLKVMKEFLNATDTLLKNGEKILIYPEQALWPNYRKPRPLKIGAYHIAAKSDASILPMFIAIEPSDYKDKKGNPVDAWTVYFLDPIYPNFDLPIKDREKDMMNRNYEALVEIYEEVYNEKLVYNTDKVEL